MARVAAAAQGWVSMRGGGWVADPRHALPRGGSGPRPAAASPKKRFQEMSGCKSGLSPTARQKQGWRCGLPKFPPPPGDK